MLISLLPLPWLYQIFFKIVHHTVTDYMNSHQASKNFVQYFLCTGIAIRFESRWFYHLLLKPCSLAKMWGNFLFQNYYIYHNQKWILYIPTNFKVQGKASQSSKFSDTSSVLVSMIKSQCSDTNHWGSASKGLIAATLLYSDLIYFSHVTFRRVVLAALWNLKIISAQSLWQLSVKCLLKWCII